MPIKIKVYNQQAEVTGEIELSEKIFGVKINSALVHQAAVAQMANERQVLAHTKDRSEVRGGGKKPWRQKGTGRARHGSIRSPLWIGGGVTFGPTKFRNFKKNINKKMKQKAIFMALSDKVAGENIFILDKLAIAEYKTKLFNKLLSGIEQKISNIGRLDSLVQPQNEAGKTAGQPEIKKTKTKEKRSVLLILDKKDDKVKNSGRNLTGVEIINLENINLIDLLKYKNILLTVEGVKKFEEKYK